MAVFCEYKGVKLEISKRIWGQSMNTYTLMFKPSQAQQMCMSYRGSF